MPHVAGASIDVPLPYEGIDGWLSWILAAAFFVVVLAFCWSIALAVLAERWSLRITRRDRQDAEEGVPVDGSERAWFWVFMVPALNEELTIADSVQRLRAVEATNRMIVVIDDGSDDGTSRILRDMVSDDLVVIRRQLPDAQHGKAAALNHAWREIREPLRKRGIPRDRVVTCIVDADGRLGANAPARAARLLVDPKVGGIQVLVRIYNRDHVLAWFQDFEFRVAGWFYQSARSFLGCAGLGGNGQFAQLVALDDVADQHGPWRDTLTEDLDLGLRLLVAGWRNVHDNYTQVDQQGLSSLRLLYRQRTRWSQGNIQALSLLPKVIRARSISVGARFEQVAALLMPVWQFVVGVSFVAAIVLILTREVLVFGHGSPWTFLFFYLLGFAGVILACATQGWRMGRWRGLFTGLLVMQVYAMYTWLLWPVLLRALGRQMIGRSGWAKTAREAIDEGDKVRIPG